MQHSQQSLYSDKEDKLIIARAEDAMAKAEKQYCVTTVGFLNPHQRKMIKDSLYLNSGNTDITAEFIGGYPEAERALLVFRPEFIEFTQDDVLSAVHISGRELQGLTHRDYLGSLMGLGIVRESIGDIVVFGDGAYIFAKERIGDYIIQNLSKIGRRGVKCTLCLCSEAKLPESDYKEVRGTVSSLRLDAVLAFSAGISRSRAADMIGKGLVSVNFETAVSVSRTMIQDDLMSVRGIGRMRIKEIGSLTRKGRTGITVLKYK